MCLLEKILIKILVGIYKIIYTPGVESPLLSLSERGVRKKGQLAFPDSDVKKVKN